VFAIAFDLSTEATKQNHPRGRQQAYQDIRDTLEPHGFNRIQGSTYASEHEDFSRLYLAIAALHRLEWFGPSLKNIRVLRMEQGADFTQIMRTRR
jgi:CRISPR-associated endonuclease Cas2